jgi:2-dehydropantoate 2-reductase
MELDKYKVGLVGAGAVGLYYASYFKRAGCDFTIITRDIHSYLTNVISIDSKNELISFSVDSIISYDDRVNASFDLLIVATKSLPGIDIASKLHPFVSSKTVILIIQNGLDVEDSFLDQFKQPILRGLAFVCVKRLTKTLIEHMAFGQLTFGVKQGDILDSSIQHFLSVLNLTALDYDHHHDIEYAIWKKLLWNIPFNLLSVYFGGVDTAFLLNHNEAFQYINEMMDEVIATAQALNVPLTQQNKLDMIELTKQMSPYKTSMCLDYEFGRDMEIEAILGSFVRKATLYRIPVFRSNYIYLNLI